MYKVIDDLPIGFNFNNRSENELKAYKEWFIRNKEKRLEELAKAVTADDGVSKDLKLDFSEESLIELGRWLKDNVSIEKLSPEAYDRKRKSVPSYIDINDWDLTVRTYSLLVDIGIYWGEVFIKEFPKLKWTQFISKIKDDADHGHMVIRGFGKKDVFNPIRVMAMLGLSLADNSQGSERLHQLHLVWKAFLK
jgi:hypothetical protein